MSFSHNVFGWRNTVKGNQFLILLKGKNASNGRKTSRSRVPFLQIPETFRTHFEWHNSLFVFKTKASRSTKLCSYFNFYSLYNIWKDQLYRVSWLEFYEWLFGHVKFSGLSRKGPQVSNFCGGWKKGQNKRVRARKIRGTNLARARVSFSHTFIRWGNNVKWNQLLVFAEKKKASNRRKTSRSRVEKKKTQASLNFSYIIGRWVFLGVAQLVTLHGLRGSTQRILLSSSDTRCCIYKYSEENSDSLMGQWAHCRCLLIPALVHGCEHLSTVKFSTFTFVLNRIFKKALTVGSPSVSLQSSPPPAYQRQKGAFKLLSSFLSFVFLKEGEVSEPRTTTGSELVFYLTTTFILWRIFSLVETISFKIWENSAMRNVHFRFPSVAQGQRSLRRSLSKTSKVFCLSITRSLLTLGKHHRQSLSCPRSRRKVRRRLGKGQSPTKTWKGLLVNGCRCFVGRLCSTVKTCVYVAP